MKEAKPMELPLAGHFRLSKTMAPQTEVEAQQMETVPYASGVGSLMYDRDCEKQNTLNPSLRRRRSLAPKSGTLLGESSTRLK